MFHKVEELHACTYSTPETIEPDCLGFKLSKLRFQRDDLFDDFLKEAINIHNRYSRGCGGCNPRRYGSSLFVC